MPRHQYAITTDAGNESKLIEHVCGSLKATTQDIEMIGWSVKDAPTVRITVDRSLYVTADDVTLAVIGALITATCPIHSVVVEPYDSLTRGTESSTFVEAER